MIHHWDFFGPDAQKTAEHFKIHFEQFTESMKLSPSSSGFFTAQPGHVCFWVELTDAQQAETTEKKLRPRRSLSSEEHNQLLEQINSNSST